MKEEFTRYLERGRDALLWKLDGVSEYDARRPMVKTGTNLLGLVKHVASVQSGYLGLVFDRPFPEDGYPWLADDAEPGSDMWATADESREFILDFYAKVWAHSEATIAALPLEAPGVVPWWPAERRNVSLRLVLIHLIAETQRHAGHADIVRELVDGFIGDRPGNDDPTDDATWDAYRARLEQAAREAAGL